MLRQLQVELADGKGVPLIRERVEATPVQGPKPVLLNNRRMATGARVYSLDRSHPTPENVMSRCSVTNVLNRPIPRRKDQVLAINE